MTTSSIIRNRVAEMPADVVFTYQDFGLPTESNGSVLKTLNRMAASGEYSPTLLKETTSSCSNFSIASE